jgi:LPS sulfotransferase NodH/2-polyprenyl-3-methyl-5-hydroxy-6-metoxy-1,4-benzoquinol methylase
MQVKSTADEKPIRSMSDERFDFEHSAPLRKSYIIASSARSGSTYLARSLAQTGLLGTPSEVFNSATNELQTLMARFKAYSAADYIAKLLARRTSRNGIFGIKAHFHQFEAFLKKYPALLEALAPVTYIYIDRRDKVAQAVSMAKALQTDQWSSQWRGRPDPVLRYDRGLIEKSLKEVELQDARWLQWFETHDIAPFRVTYEDLIADPAGIVRGIVELLGVRNDEPDVVRVPTVEKQSDDTNQEWIERFARETLAAGEHSDTDVADAERRVPVTDLASEPSTTTGGHFFDRYDRLIGSLPEGPNSATGFIGAIRLRRRYDAIIAQNRELFRNARVLDIISSNGFWSLAALDAGAAHVVAIETSESTVEAAKKNFAEYGINSKSYQIIDSKIFTALQTFDPEQFDVILCKGILEYCYSSELFRHFSRLRPKHIILDTKITHGESPLARFALAGKAWKGRKGKITSTPTHELIAFLCETEFRWRLVDWQAMGITDWTGVPDYARGSHRTYVLDRLS